MRPTSNEPVFKQISNCNEVITKAVFSCHPDDFGLYFDDLKKDVLSEVKITIYYLEDQRYVPESIDDYCAYLKDINLFIFPITSKFINEPSRAKDIDFNYALKNKTAILPVLVEPNLYNMFNEKCATIQVLDKTSNDPTQDPYKVKLAGFLESVLIDPETAKKIRDAFDAYIFLSYRKKDRKYAQEIISIVLQNEFMRDIAVWYDEFLTPGEDFNDEIIQNLIKSKLMALVVTPNLNEKYGDKGNYVIEEEYPSALKEDKPVLPIEALPTDFEELKNNFKDINNPISKEETGEISRLLKETFFKEGLKENEDPNHLYFIGLAYLNGIDTERNVDRAISILSNSLDRGLIEAGFVLFRTFYNVVFDYQKAIEYADKSIELMNGNYAEYESFLDEYFRMLYDCKYYDKAGQINKTIFAFSDEKGKLRRKNLEAMLHFKKGNNEKCIEIKYEVYNFCKKNYGLNNELTKDYGSSLMFVCYGTDGQDEIIKELECDGFDLYSHIFGNAQEQKVPVSKPVNASADLNELLKDFDRLDKKETISDELINICTKIANIYHEAGQYNEYLQFKNKTYQFTEGKYGINDRKTDRCLKSVLAAYRDYFVQTKDESCFDEMVRLCEQDFSKKKETFGEKDPVTMKSLETLIYNCEFCKRTDKATELKKKLLRIRTEVYGPENPKVIELQEELNTKQH